MLAIPYDATKQPAMIRVRCGACRRGHPPEDMTITRDGAICAACLSGYAQCEDCRLWVQQTMLYSGLCYTCSHNRDAIPNTLGTYLVTDPSGNWYRIGEEDATGYLHQGRTVWLKAQRKAMIRREKVSDCEVLVVYEHTPATGRLWTRRRLFQGHSGPREALDYAARLAGELAHA